MHRKSLCELGRDLRVVDVGEDGQESQGGRWGSGTEMVELLCAG